MLLKEAFQRGGGVSNAGVHPTTRPKLLGRSLRFFSEGKKTEGVGIPLSASEALVLPLPCGVHPGRRSKSVLHSQNIDFDSKKALLFRCFCKKHPEGAEAFLTPESIPPRDPNYWVALSDFFEEKKSERVGFPSRRAKRSSCRGGGQNRFCIRKTSILTRIPPRDPNYWVALSDFFEEKKSERVGFEPTIRFLVYTLSKRAP